MKYVFLNVERWLDIFFSNVRIDLLVGGKFYDCDVGYDGESRGSFLYKFRFRYIFGYFVVSLVSLLRISRL